jgi:hypothetical protein
VEKIPAADARDATQPQGFLYDIMMELIIIIIIIIIAIFLVIEH